MGVGKKGTLNKTLSIHGMNSEKAVYILRSITMGIAKGFREDGKQVKELNNLQHKR